MTDFIETTEKKYKKSNFVEQNGKCLLHEEKTLRHNEKTVTALSILNILYS